MHEIFACSYRTINMSEPVQVDDELLTSPATKRRKADSASAKSANKGKKKRKLKDDGDEAAGSKKTAKKKQKKSVEDEQIETHLPIEIVGSDHLDEEFEDDESFQIEAIEKKTIQEYYPHKKVDLFSTVVEEISLEGLDGITLEGTSEKDDEPVWF